MFVVVVDSCFVGFAVFVLIIRVVCGCGLNVTTFVGLCGCVWLVINLGVFDGFNYSFGL